MKLWSRIRNALKPSAMDIIRGDALYTTVTERGYAVDTCRALLELSDAAIAHFYARLAEDHDPISPVAGEKDTAWMVDRDFCFVNVRATGLGDEPGTFIHAAKLLPGIRADAIHLAPFTLYDFNIIYVVQSVESITPRTVDPELAMRGIDAADQLRAFVQAAHLLGKAIGFDLEPHVAQFAIPVLMHPEMFRWIKLYEMDKRWLDYLLTNEDMMLAEHQHTIVQEVRTTVRNELALQRLNTLEFEDGDDPATHERKTTVYHALIKRLIHGGYWPVLSHMLRGVGVPAFKHYHDDDYPVYEYRDATGEEPDDRIFGVLTPFKFYHDMLPNRAPATKPRRNDMAINYFTQIFPRWRDQFGFDFVRFDSVDHVFDSVVDDDPDYPAADRPTPAILQEAITHSKSAEKPYIGALAERMGNEIDAYAGIGFDLILGNDMMDQIDQAHMEKCFTLYDQLTQFNRDRDNRFAITYAVDTHDTGDPFLWGTPLLQKVGSEGVLLRQFIARYISAGRARRPKYEVMGVQDMSYGLYKSNVTEKNLTWVGDEEHCLSYHFIEDVYAAHRRCVDIATITRREITDRYTWWVLDAGERVLIPIVFYHAGEIEIDITQWCDGDHAIIRHDYERLESTQLPADSTVITEMVDTLPWFVLYEIK